MSTVSGTYSSACTQAHVPPATSPIEQEVNSGKEKVPYVYVFCTALTLRTTAASS